jgi:hypothetical protein
MGLLSTPKYLSLLPRTMILLISTFKTSPLSIYILWGGLETNEGTVYISNISKHPDTFQVKVCDIGIRMWTRLMLYKRILA